MPFALKYFLKMDSKNHTYDLIASGGKKTKTVQAMMFTPASKGKISFFRNERKIFKRLKLWLSLLLTPGRLRSFLNNHVYAYIHHIERSPRVPGTKGQEMNDCPHGSPICPYHTLYTGGRGAIGTGKHFTIFLWTHTFLLAFKLYLLHPFSRQKSWIFLRLY